jgi:type III pantothenate kinase
MPVSQQVYLLDAGNTQLKLALAQDGLIQWVKHYTLAQFPLKSLDSNIPFAFSSVVNDDFSDLLKTHFTKVFEVKNKMNLPFAMLYKSPDTLGKDRLCNAAALSQVALGKPRLAIDLGTCIKFDFINEQQEYLGGSISPGLQMRAKALANYTAKLPELPISPTQQFIGNSSQTSIEIGTFLGWQKEIEGLLNTYLERYPDLVVYLTGGDAVHFDMGQKIGIFVHENLTLEGILSLYHSNE